MGRERAQSGVETRVDRSVKLLERIAKHSSAQHQTVFLAWADQLKADRSLDKKSLQSLYKARAFFEKKNKREPEDEKIAAIRSGIGMVIKNLSANQLYGYLQTAAENLGKASSRKKYIDRCVSQFEDFCRANIDGVRMVIEELIGKKETITNEEQEMAVILESIIHDFQEQFRSLYPKLVEFNQPDELDDDDFDDEESRLNEVDQSAPLGLHPEPPEDSGIRYRQGTIPGADPQGSTHIASPSDRLPEGFKPSPPQSLPPSQRMKKQTGRRVPERQ